MEVDISSFEKDLVDVGPLLGFHVSQTWRLVASTAWDMGHEK